MSGIPRGSGQPAAGSVRLRGEERRGLKRLTGKKRSREDKGEEREGRGERRGEKEGKF